MVWPPSWISFPFPARRGAASRSWSRWHARIIVALGTSWILDGLEVTLVGSLSGVLASKDGLSLSDEQITSAATIYLAGAVVGALLFGRGDLLLQLVNLLVRDV